MFRELLESMKQGGFIIPFEIEPSGKIERYRNSVSSYPLEASGARGARDDSRYNWCEKYSAIFLP
jgi:hypothetical protein